MTVIPPTSPRIDPTSARAAAREPNDGSRLSGLQIARLAVGELDPDAVGPLAQDPHTRAGLQSLEGARSRVKPFDARALRLRAVQGAEQAPLPARANRPWAWVVPLVALAAALLIAVLPGGRGVGGSGGPGFRAADGLEVYQLGRAGSLAPYAGEALGAEAVLGFKVLADGHRSVVLLSVDRDGRVSVFWPESGDAEPLAGTGLVPLPGTAVLDDAPGPEVFVAVYDTPVPVAVDLARRTWGAGGADALFELARTRAHVDAVAVERAR